MNPVERLVRRVDRVQQALQNQRYPGQEVEVWFSDRAPGDQVRERPRVPRRPGDLSPERLPPGQGSGRG